MLMKSAETIRGLPYKAILVMTDPHASRAREVCEGAGPEVVAPSASCCDHKIKQQIIAVPLRLRRTNECVSGWASGELANVSERQMERWRDGPGPRSVSDESILERTDHSNDR